MPHRLWIVVVGLAACSGKDDVEEPAGPPPRPVVPGAPMAGVAESFLELPVGTPLGGFTTRCSCLGNQSKVDDRQSAYNTTFVESVGIQTLPSLDAIWLENGDDTLVILKTDTIYPFDHLVEVVAERLSAATGDDLTHKVVHTTNHTHHAFGAFSDAIAFYLGTDRYNEEIFQRFADQLVTTALRARDGLQPVKLGMGWSDTWDPTGAVYHDRRGSNDALVVNDPWGVPIPTGRDPHLGILRIDTLDDAPLAMVVNFGVHGIILDTDSPMVSSDAGGGIEAVLEETFDTPVMVMFTQGSGGDASPGGVQDDYARIESLGELAAPEIRAVYDRVPTSDQPIRLETFGWNIEQDLDAAHVDRNGTVDFSYAPFEENRFDDGVTLNEDGTLAMPIDEFNTHYGAAFCGTGDLDLPVGGIPTASTFPYTNCMEVEFLSTIINVWFKREEPFPLPVPHLERAAAAATRIGPISTLRADGSVGDDEQIIGFFPGEPTAMYVEMFRRRIAGQYGLPHAMVFGYSQDEEGYLLLPEDWLMGGYEPDITIWGPLAAETVQEVLIEGIGTILMDEVHQDPDPNDLYPWTDYADVPLPELAPDLTPDAGTRLTEEPEIPPWTPLDIGFDLDIPAEVPRVQGMVQLRWEGGDPAVDLPNVTVERLEGADWVALTTRAGREIGTGHHDILLTWTPDPLYPVIDAQAHAWWAAWQPVGHAVDRAGLPTGTYRLHVRGQRYTGGNTTWPWNAEPYELTSPEFQVVPAALTVAVAAGGLDVTLPARADGYRLIHLDGADRGDNPVVGPVDVIFTTAAGEVRIDDLPVSVDAGHSFVPVEIPADASSVRVEDRYGNGGDVTL